MSAVGWFLVLVLAASVLMSAGIYILAGLGWTLMYYGLFLFAAAWFVRMGITQ